MQRGEDRTHNKPQHAVQMLVCNTKGPDTSVCFEPRHRTLDDNTNMESHSPVATVMVMLPAERAQLLLAHCEPIELKPIGQQAPRLAWNRRHSRHGVDPSEVPELASKLKRPLSNTCPPMEEGRAATSSWLLAVLGWLEIILIELVHRLR